MKLIKMILSAIMMTTMVLSFSGCMTAEEQAEMDAINRELADKIAEKYFSDDFEYAFDFYNGGDGGPAMDMYIYTDGKTYNGITVPVKENAPSPYIYYDCELHQFENGGWMVMHWEDAEKPVL